MTLTQSTDHETALAAGFDIVSASHEDGARWVRPDSAEIWRVYFSPTATFRGRRSDGDSARFYTMAEAVEWIGPVAHDDCTCSACMERREERYDLERGP